VYSVHEWGLNFKRNGNIYCYLIVFDVLLQVVREDLCKRSSSLIALADIGVINPFHLEIPDAKCVIQI